MINKQYIIENLNPKTIRVSLIVLMMIIMSTIVSGCSGDCASSEDMMTDPKIIALPGYDDKTYKPSNLASYWIPTDVTVKSNTDKDIKFDVLFNKVNLCGLSTTTTPSSEDIKIQRFATDYPTGIKVVNGDYLSFTLNKDSIKINCASPDPRIHVYDIDKCQNGFYKEGESSDKITSFEGKTIELESYVAPNFSPKNFNVGWDQNAFWNDNHDTDTIYNAFIPTIMIFGMYDTNSFTQGTFYTLINGYEPSTYDAIIPSKILIVPEDYHEKITEKDKDKKDVDYHIYSQFPTIPNDDKTFLAAQTIKSSTEAERQEVQQKYWCRIYNNAYTAIVSGSTTTKTLNRSENIEGIMLNQMCDKFYYLDKIDSPDLMKYKDFTAATLSSKPKGNTGLVNSKIISAMESMSYMDPLGASPPPSGATLDEDDMEPIEIHTLPPEIKPEDFQMNKLPMTNSRFFYMLNANIGNPTQNTYGNVNTDYASCGSKSNLARCDASGNVQIPLDSPIPVKRAGEVFIKVGVNSSDIQKFIGNANIKVTKTCPNKSIYGLLVPAGAQPAAFAFKPGDANTFEIPLYENGNLEEALDKIIIKHSDIKDKLSGGSQDATWYLYLAIKDNEDFDGYKNNTGSVKLKTQIKRDSSKSVTRFINRTIDKMMTILYGPEDPSTFKRSGGIVNSIYNNMISSSKFQAIIRACAVLMITIYGISIVMGLAQFNGGDLLRTIIKFGIVFILLQKGSWDFFNDRFFNIFINGPRQLLTFVTTAPDKPLINYSTSDPGSGNYIFGPVNDILERFIDTTVWKQIMALIFAGPFGWIFFWFLLQSSMIMLTGTLSALITYITSMTLVGIFISVAPLFIITLMFKGTTKIFKAWVKVLMTNSLNVVFVFGGLSMISGVLSVFINSVFGYGVCTDCALQYHGPVENFNFCILYADLPAGFSNGLSLEERTYHSMSQANLESARNDFYGIPIPFSAFVCFIILSHMTANLVGFFSTMAEDISSVDYGSPTRESNIASKVAETMKGWVGKDQEAKQNAISQKGRSGDVKGGKIEDSDKKAPRK